MTLSARKSHALELFDGIAGDYDRWAQLLSFGNDRRWHDLLVGRLDVPRDGLVADVATGTAAVAIEIARHHECRVIGIDQNPAMLERGRERVRAAGLDERIELVQGEAESLPLDDRSVDALVHTYLLRYVDDPPAVLRELARVVRPGGRSPRWSSACRGCLVPGLVGMDTDRPPVRRAGGRWRLVSHRPLPGPQHRGLLAAASARSGAGLVARRGHRRAACAAALGGRGCHHPGHRP